MMPIFMLILITTSGHITMQEFVSLDKCEYTKAIIVEKSSPSWRSRPMIEYIECVPL
jgi:hypothetical protein